MTIELQKTGGIEERIKDLEDCFDQLTDEQRECFRIIESKIKCLEECFEKLNQEMEGIKNIINIDMKLKQQLNEVKIKALASCYDNLNYEQKELLAAAKSILETANEK